MAIPLHVFAEIGHHLDRARESLAGMKKAETAKDMRIQWEDFLAHFGRTVGKTISASLNDNNTRAWGHRLKNQSNGDDPGLSYLREARNVAEHGLDLVSEYHDSEVLVAKGLFSISGNSSVSIKNCSMNGKPIGDFTVETRLGRVSRVAGTPKLPIHQINPRVALKPLNNPEKRRKVDVVDRILGHEVTKGDALQLADVAIEAIALKIKELRDISS